MSPLQWVSLFAEFAQLAPDVVDAFADRHPELREAPKPDEQREVRDGFLADVADKFPSDE